jgi:hypothetical protein
MRTWYVQIGVILAAFAVLSMTTTTNSYASSLKYGVMTSASNAGGFSDATVGQTITASAATNNGAVTIVKFEWIDPSSTVQQTDIVTVSTAAGGSACLTTATKYTGGVTQADVTSGAGFKCFADTFTIPSITGDWGMQATFCSSDQTSCTPPQKIDIKAVSFFVLPESFVGAAGLTIASVAALGGFMVLRSRGLPRSVPI